MTFTVHIYHPGAQFIEERTREHKEARKEVANA